MSVPFKSNFLDLKTGIRIHYYDEGNKNWEIPILFIHGWPDLAYGWRFQIKEFSKKYRVIAPDHRGFGLSSRPKEKEKYTLKYVEEDMIDLIDKLGIKKVVLVCHDWGSPVGYNLCMRYEERIHAMVSFCTPFLPVNLKKDPFERLMSNPGRYSYQKYFQLKEAEEELSKNVEKTIRILLRRYKDKRIPGDKNLFGDDVYDRKGLFVNIKEDEVDPGTLLNTEERKHYVEMYKKGFENLNWYRNSTENWINSKEFANKKILVPFLFVCPENDPVFPPSMTLHMESFIPNMKREVIQNCGHWVMAEYPDLCNQILGWFLGDLFSKGKL